MMNGIFRRLGLSAPPSSTRQAQDRNVITQGFPQASFDLQSAIALASLNPATLILGSGNLNDLPASLPSLGNAFSFNSENFTNTLNAANSLTLEQLLQAGFNTQRTPLSTTLLGPSATTVQAAVNPVLPFGSPATPSLGSQIPASLLQNLPNQFNPFRNGLINAPTALQIQTGTSSTGILTGVGAITPTVVQKPSLTSIPVAQPIETPLMAPLNPFSGMPITPSNASPLPPPERDALSTLSRYTSLLDSMSDGLLDQAFHVADLTCVTADANNAGSVANFSKERIFLLLGID
jgi:hypothetical protein